MVRSQGKTMKPTQKLPCEKCKVLEGDSLDVLKSIGSCTFHCVVTSPPYWGLRDYGLEGQIGAEQRLDDYIRNLVNIFREVKRVLRDDGTLWLNVGDSYTSGNRKWRDSDRKNRARAMNYRPPNPEGLKDKELIGIPWKLAFALQADGWYLRSDIIWYKPNCQPESVKDRPTRSHEHVFLLTKSAKYFYDQESVKEPTANGAGKRQRRDVWAINNKNSKEAHFAMFPLELVEVCIRAGSPKDGLVLDPFFGSGSVGVAAVELGRRCLGIELHPEYVELAQARIQELGSMLFIDSMDVA
jgi:site-specific DNA-methyltransferase (adenine-specific)/site-specific DNA-methyltransferase (cytosine-N4-specific)